MSDSDSKSHQEERVYNADRYGIYYTDELGNRIYAIRGKEFIVVDKKLVRIERIDDELKVIPDTADNADLALIVHNLGKPLKSGLASIFMYRPDDAIEYLVKHLLNFRLNELHDLLDE